MTNTEPVATPRTECVASLCSTDSEHSDVEAYNIMYDHARQLERELQAERERAQSLMDGHEEDEAEILELHGQIAHIKNERDKLRAELAALKEALRNPTQMMLNAGVNAFCDTFKVKAAFKAMTAHLLKE